MTYSCSQLIFDFLCGILFIIGFMSGFNYEEISVYTCIYLWPALCTATPVLVACTALFNWIKKPSFGNTLNLAASSAVLCIFYSITKLFYNEYTGSNEAYGAITSVHDQFMACQQDIIQMASNLGVTYAEANLWIYCFLFISIEATMWLWLELTLPFKCIVNRLWR